MVIFKTSLHSASGHNEKAGTRESPFPPETARKSDKIHAAVFFQVLETGITDRLERKEIREVSSLKVSYLK